MKTQDTNFNPKMSSDVRVIAIFKALSIIPNDYEKSFVMNVINEENTDNTKRANAICVFFRRGGNEKTIYDILEYATISSSEPLEEKPYECQCDCNLDACHNERCWDLQECQGTPLQKANARIAELENANIELHLAQVKKLQELYAKISSLESELKEAKKSVQLLHEDMINAEKRGQEKAESEIKALREERDKFAIGFFDFLHSTWNGYLIKPYKEYMIIKPNWMSYESAVKEIDKGNTHGFYTVEFLFEQFKQSKPIP